MLRLYKLAIRLAWINAEIGRNKSGDLAEFDKRRCSIDDRTDNVPGDRAPLIVIVCALWSRLAWQCTGAWSAN